MTACFGRLLWTGGRYGSAAGRFAAQLSVGVAQRVVLDMFAEAGGIRVALGASRQLAGIRFLYQIERESIERCVSTVVFASDASSHQTAAAQCRCRKLCN